MWNPSRNQLFHYNNQRNSGFDEVMTLQAGFPSLDKVPGRTISNLLPSQIVSLHRGESIGHRLTNLGKYDHWFNAGYGMFLKCFSQMWRWYGLGSTSKDLLSVCWKCAKYLRCVDVCVRPAQVLSISCSVDIFWFLFHVLYLYVVRDHFHI